MFICDYWLQSNLGKKWIFFWLTNYYVSIAIWWYQMPIDEVNIHTHPLDGTRESNNVLHQQCANRLSHYFHLHQWQGFVVKRHTFFWFFTYRLKSNLIIINQTLPQALGFAKMRLLKLRNIDIWGFGDIIKEVWWEISSSPVARFRSLETHFFSDFLLFD